MESAHFTSKRSPLILILNLLILEAVFVALYYIGTILSSESKLQVFQFFFFSRFLSYETFRPFFLSAVQFVITVYVFLRWYCESYALRPSELSHRRGIIFKRERALTLDPATTTDIRHGFLPRVLHYGTITVRNALGKELRVSDIPQPDEFAQKINEAITPFFIQSSFDIEKLLVHTEHDRLEFKSSLRVDRKSGKINRALEHAAFKTVAAFLNTSGGYLVIGVDDTRKPVGLRPDYDTLQRKDADGFEIHFTQLFNAMLGADFSHLVKLWFHTIDGEDVCVVQVAAGHKPAYLVSDNNEEFFIRTGNATTALKLSELDAYRHSRWPR